MIEVKAPNEYEYEIDDDPTIFLAGSIEMGVAERWQDKVVNALAGYDCLVLNPRRDDFDPTAKQEASDPYFSTQVNWELDAIEASDIVLFYFDPATKSPITLLELGLVATARSRAIVCCPEGFWRRGNVEIVCKRKGIILLNTLEELITQVTFLIR